MTEITDLDFDPPKVDPRDRRIDELGKQLRDSERRAEYYMLQCQQLWQQPAQQQYQNYIRNQQGQCGL